MRIRDDAVIQCYPETTDWAVVPAAPHLQRRPVLMKALMPDLEMMQGSPEAPDWTAACAVTWSMPLNFWKELGMNIGGGQGFKGEDPKNHLLGHRRKS